MGFVEGLDIENKKSRMALVTFSDVIKLEFHLNKYDNRLDILEHIERMPYSRGSTNTAKALEFVTDTMFTQDNGDRNSARNVAFLITDGQSNNREDTMKQAKDLKDKGIHLFVAGVGECFESDYRPHIFSEAGR